MKDLSNAQSRASNRNTAYPKKRPSPVVRDGGVAKRKSGSPITAASVIAGLSRRLQDEEAASRRLAALQQHNLQKLLESEYRNDVLKYMHEMEVGLAVSCTHPAWSGRSISPFISIERDDVFRRVHGSATRDSLGDASVPRRLHCRVPHVSPPSS